MRYLPESPVKQEEEWDEGTGTQEEERGSSGETEGFPEVMCPSHTHPPCTHTTLSFFLRTHPSQQPQKITHMVTCQKKKKKKKNSALCSMMPSFEMKTLGHHIYSKYRNCMVSISSFQG